MSFMSIAQTHKTTTYYIIRHAEKDLSNPADKNPHLDSTGLQRAENWKKILGSITFDAVYSTNYYRTIETAQPTALKDKLDITLYDPRTIDISDFIKTTKGKTVLIVGHSNTIPQFANMLIDSEKYNEIDESVYGNLYIVTTNDIATHDQLLTID